MSSTVDKIRKFILGDDIYERCLNGGMITEDEITNISTNLDVSVNTIITLCQLKTKNISDRDKVEMFKHDVIMGENNLNKGQSFLFLQHYILGNLYNQCKQGVPLTLKQINEIANNHDITKDMVIKLCKLHPYSTLEYPNSFLYRLSSDLATNTKIPQEFRNIIKNINYENYYLLSYYFMKNIKSQLISRLTNLINEEKNRYDMEKRPYIDSLITIINPEQYFYTAYPDKKTVEEFTNEKIIWSTPDISQSLLYIISDKKMSHPVLFKYKFNRPLILFNSLDKTNLSILKTLFGSNEDYRSYMFYIMNDKNWAQLGTFEGNNNFKILALIESLNYIISDSGIKIDGYRNRYDQNELALIDFNTIIDTNSVSRAVYKSIDLILEDKTLTKKFPLSPSQDLFDLFFKFIEKDKIKSKFSAINFSQYTKEDDQYYFSCPRKKTSDGQLAQYVLRYMYDNDTFIREFYCMEAIRDDTMKHRFDTY